MTAEEAYKYAKDINICVGCLEDFGSMLPQHADKTCESCEHRQFFVMAEKALEKQIPKKPVEEFETDLCPCCGGVLMYYLGHCHLCGQAIDWEEDE